MRICTSFGLLAITTFCFVGVSEAQVTVSGVFFSIDFGKRPLRNVTVGNASEAPLYVSVVVEEIANPWEKEFTSTPSADLIASPKNFSIPTKGERQVRLLLRSAMSDKERVFRVAFSPTDNGFGQEVTSSAGGRKAMIKVMTGVGILVFVDPVNPVSKVSWVRTDKQITFTNIGNRHAHLTNGKACNKDGAECTSLAARRLYGGREFVVDVPESKVVTYLKREGVSGDFEQIEIAPSQTSGETSAPAASAETPDSESDAAKEKTKEEDDTDSQDD